MGCLKKVLYLHAPIKQTTKSARGGIIFDLKFGVNSFNFVDLECLAANEQRKKTQKIAKKS